MYMLIDQVYGMGNISISLIQKIIRTRGVAQRYGTGSVYARRWIISPALKKDSRNITQIAVAQI